MHIECVYDTCVIIYLSLHLSLSFYLALSHTLPSLSLSLYSQWYNEIRQLCPKTPLLLVATKLDKREEEKESSHLSLTHTTPQTITKREGIQLMKSLKAKGYVECSYKTMEGLEELISAILMVIKGEGLNEQEVYAPFSYQSLKEQYSQSCTIL